jgi:hypothetical protein
MILYVESNFVLEIVLRQEQVAPAEELLNLAEGRRIEIVFPAFCLIEPFWTIGNRADQRETLRKQLNQELTRLSRSDSHRELVANLNVAIQPMVELVHLEQRSFESTARQMLGVGKAIEMGQEIVESALSYQSRYGLTFFDAVVYSAIISDIVQRGDPGPKCFVSKDKKAFFNLEEFKSHNCRYISSFEEALKFSRNEMK